MPAQFSPSHTDAIFEMLCPVGSYGFGGIVRYCSENLGYMQNILDKLFASKNVDEHFIISLFNSLFESIKDLYMEIGIVSPITRSFEWPECEDYHPKGRLIHDTIKKSAFFCSIVEYAVRKGCSNTIKNKLISFVEIFVFYNNRLSEILLGEIGSLCDMAGFTADEMDRRIEGIK